MNCSVKTGFLSVFCLTSCNPSGGFAELPGCWGWIRSHSCGPRVSVTCDPAERGGVRHTYTTGGKSSEEEKQTDWGVICVLWRAGVLVGGCALFWEVVAPLPLDHAMLFLLFAPWQASLTQKINNIKNKRAITLCVCVCPSFQKSALPELLLRSETP